MHESVIWFFFCQRFEYLSPFRYFVSTFINSFTRVQPKYYH